MARSRLFAAASLLLVAQLVHPQEAAKSHLRTVEAFVAAFNAHDSSGMADHVAEDVEWLSIEGDKLAVATRGKSALIASMDAYFQSCPTCRSSLSATISTPGRISAIEIASWQGKSGATSQRAISVYEFSDGLIQRVYYFPSEQ